MTWALVVLVASPIAIGLPLNHVLRRAESKGSLSWWHYALGGQHSAAGQSPSEHDLFLQEMWSVDELGQAVAKLDPERGMWIAKDAIAELYFLKGDPLS